MIQTKNLCVKKTFLVAKYIAEIVTETHKKHII